MKSTVGSVEKNKNARNLIGYICFHQMFLTLPSPSGRGGESMMSTVAFQKKEEKEVARGGSVGLDLIGSNPIQ